MMLLRDYVHTNKVPTFTNEQMNKSFNKFKEWFDTQDELEMVFTERRLLSRIHKICGTVDAVFKNKKTGKHIVYRLENKFWDSVILTMSSFTGIKSQFVRNVRIWKLIKVS
jgi:GTP cyclohydrolase II